MTAERQSLLNQNVQAVIRGRVVAEVAQDLENNTVGKVAVFVEIPGVAPDIHFGRAGTWVWVHPSDAILEGGLTPIAGDGTNIMSRLAEASVTESLTRIGNLLQDIIEADQYPEAYSSAPEGRSAKIAREAKSILRKLLI